MPQALKSLLHRCMPGSIAARNSAVLAKVCAGGRDCSATGAVLSSVAGRCPQERTAMQRRITQPGAESGDWVAAAVAVWCRPAVGRPRRVGYRQRRATTAAAPAAELSTMTTTADPFPDVPLPAGAVAEPDSCSGVMKCLCQCAELVSGHA